MIIQDFPPMGVYETLFKFLDATGQYMGTEGTHPWAQGFPLTTQLPNGPEILANVEFSSSDLKYPQAAGNDELRETIANYYNHFYGSRIQAANVAVFAGGRPGILAILAFLQAGTQVLIEETEYTPYWDMLKLFQIEHRLVPSNPANEFRPSLADYRQLENSLPGKSLIIKSNPCNPTGVTWRGPQLQEFVEYCSAENRGAVIDEAYEFFNAQGAESALRYIRTIDDTNLFVIGAATKGLQAPGIRIGWVVAAKDHIRIFRNFSSIAMGGVSRLSQIVANRLLELQRVTQARQAVQNYYDAQRKRYETGLSELGLELFTGDGGFYHWGRLPNAMTAEQFNQRLFQHKAAILPGTLCDMLRRGDQSPMANFIRFSFGPVLAESYEGNIEIIQNCLNLAAQPA
ncbi:MAG TPA: pyridoxal phosphate-dependent aminotransferase [Pirellulaceae bacterium]|nr:pyridoxal phosphate-dependent aminotransferase [Pirellulaceae bacterium]HMO91707.1 pyridoxal phosphate-dependent aminotransferase [Pirellulaceae bacterium]HMP68403.1 pyridoxal phosphate-dependent aminotransferase [Pirellulaceae bacterium]